MTEPFDAARLASSVARVQVTDLDSGETSELMTRSSSACHFFERFRIGDYLVQLRLDWTDIDDNGHPMLDADFLDPVTLEHDHSMRGHSAHHTASADSDERTYGWEFEDTARRLMVAVTWSVSASASASATASCTAHVIRARRAEETGHGLTSASMRRSAPIDWERMAHRICA